jgi:3',5'-cyclic AMP phosphodiesterase CpdA
VRVIAQISDLHFGRHEPEVVSALASDLNGRTPDLVVVSGDLTQRARSEEFLEARRFLDGIDPPKLVVPGNHDIPLYGLHRRLFAPFAKFDLAITPGALPGACFRDDQIAVLGINTARRFPGKNGRVSHEQMAEIRRVFCSMPSEIFKILATHHPLASSGPIGDIKLAGRSRLALRAVSDSGGRLVLSGHYHSAASSGLPVQAAAGNAVLVVHAGTATSNRLRGDEGNTYNLIRVDGLELSLTVMGYARPSGFREIRSQTYLLQDGRWRTP